MSATVIEFKPKRELVWQHACSENGQKFYLHKDGSVQCAECNEFVSVLCWGERDKP